MFNSLRARRIEESVPKTKQFWLLRYPTLLLQLSFNCVILTFINLYEILFLQIFIFVYKGNYAFEIFIALTSSSDVNIYYYD